jgi:GNAT superfamily N-acetyltransferase
VATARAFRREDQAAVEALIQDGMRERWGEAYDPAANPDVADVWASYVDRGADVIVLVEDGAVLATGTLLTPEPGTGRIVRMAVRGDHRRRGLARAVVHELLARARARGLSRAVVRTDTPWPDAVALYRSCGFEIEAQDDAETDLVLDLAPETVRPATG